MKTLKTLLFACLLLALPIEGTQAVELMHSVGGTAVGGGNFSAKPDGLSGPSDDGIGFRGNAGGWAYGGGLTYELRVGNIGALEIDFLYETSVLQRYVTVNGVDFTEKISAGLLRIPILFKLNVPVGVGRFNFGVGPEFTVPMNSEGSVDSDYPNFTLSNQIEAEEVNSTLVTIELGLNFDLGSNLELGWKLRGGYNTSQPSEISERVTYSGSSYSVKTQNTWDFRMLLGVNYLIPQPTE
jgi:hypothetical protein